MNQRQCVVVLLCALICLVGKHSAAQPSHVAARRCTVWKLVSNKPSRLCRIYPGQPVTVLGRAWDDILNVQTSSCRGLVRAGCVALSRGVSSEQQSVQNLEQPSRERFALGAALQADLLNASVSYSSRSSYGHGYGALVTGIVPLAPVVRMRLSAGYHLLQLTQEYDATGALEDSNPAVFDQRWRFATVSSLLGYQLSSAAAYNNAEPLWWFELGIDYKHPLSAVQTSPGTNSVAFKPVDRLVLGVLGLSLELLLTQRWSLDVAGQLYYNLASAGGSSLTGMRIAIGVIAAL